MTFHHISRWAKIAESITDMRRTVRFHLSLSVVRLFLSLILLCLSFLASPSRAADRIHGQGWNGFAQIGPWWRSASIGPYAPSAIGAQFSISIQRFLGRFFFIGAHSGIAVAAHNSNDISSGGNWSGITLNPIAPYVGVRLTPFQISIGYPLANTFTKLYKTSDGDTVSYTDGSLIQGMILIESSGLANFAIFGRTGRYATERVNDLALPLTTKVLVHELGLLFCIRFL